MRLLATAATLCLLAFACTYRTELLASHPTGGSTPTSGQGGSGGTSTGGTIASGAATSTGGSAAGNDRSCTSDDDCVQCVYISTPSGPDQCEGGLGCCGGQVMSVKACATNEAAWRAHCANRGYTVPVCPCIYPCGIRPTCKNGQCGFWC